MIVLISNPVQALFADNLKRNTHAEADVTCCKESDSAGKTHSGKSSFVVKVFHNPLAVLCLICDMAVLDGISSSDRTGDGTNQANTCCCSTYDGEDLTGLVLLGGAYVSLVVDVLTDQLENFLVCKGVAILILKACAVLAEGTGAVLCVCNYA